MSIADSIILSLTKIAVLFVIWAVYSCIIASVMSSACKRKGYLNGEGHVFAACFWLGIFGCLYAICLPEKNMNKTDKEEIQNTESK